LGILGILIIGGILLIIVAVAFRPKKTPATTTPSGINNSAQEKLVNQFLQHPELL
jgi:hypothetical protein